MKDIRGLLGFLTTYSRLAEGNVEDAELFSAYSFLRKYAVGKLPSEKYHGKVEASETLKGRVPEGSETGKIEDPFPLAKHFTSETPTRLDAALAVDAFVHKAHSFNSDILGEAFGCDLALASDVALPLFDFFAKTTPVNPIRKQVRGYTSAEWLGELLILKEDKPLIIAGYASVEMVDKEKHLIPRSVLDKAFTTFMSHEGRENLNFAHTNIQVGRILKEWTSPTGKRYTSGVDDKGLFVVAEVYPDTTVGKRVVEAMKKGELTAFSISGLGKNVVQKNGYKEVQELELYEITACEQPVNQGAYFKLIKSVGSSLEGVFQRTIPLGWTVKVDKEVMLPFDYKCPWLERVLKAKIGSHPEMYGTYALELSPFRRILNGVRLSDCELALAGDSLLIKHSKSDPLGLTLYRCVKKSLSSDLQRSVKFLFNSQSSETSRPLFYLSARKM